MGPDTSRRSAPKPRRGARNLALDVTVRAVVVLLAVAPRWMAAQHSEPDTLAPVKVTVLRTPFDVTTAPMDVTAVAARDATVARPGFALDEVLGQLGGIQVDNRLNFALGERIVIRGLGARTQFGVRGVRVIVDDIPATLADGQTSLNNVDLGSLDRAEVIRGPSSSLYGNASGGVIVLRSHPAPAQAFAPDIRLMRGSDGLSRVQLGAGGTSGRGTYVVNADRLDYLGYRDYAQARNAHANAVGTWDWDRAELKLVANAVQYDARNPGALSDSLLRVDRRRAFANNVLQQTGERGKQNQFGASTHVQLPLGELRVSGYALRRTVDNPIPPRIISLHRAADGARVAYAVTEGTSTRAITAIIGGESDLQRDDRQNYINTRGRRGALVLDQREHVTSASPFVQLSARIGPATFLGGVRYDRFRFAATDHLVNALNPDDSGIRTMTATSPSIGANYEILPGLSVYANVATGFQTPTTTELANQPTGAGGFNPTLQPEHTHSREMGAKGRDGFVSYDVALYDMHVGGELISFEVPSTPGRQFYRNAGTARHRGAEADAEVELARMTRVHASYGYTDARFTTYSGGTASYAGNRVPGIAPHIGTLSLQLGDPLSRFVSVEEHVQSATSVDDANTATSPGYAVTNLRAEARVRELSVFGGVGNLLGARYNAAVTINAAGGRYYEPAAGRSVYLGFAVAPRSPRS